MSAVELCKAPRRGSGRMTWRMPPLDALAPARLTPLWMAVLRGYLVVAGGLVLVRIVQLAIGAQG